MQFWGNSHGYDAWGNLTSTSQYVYDPENRIQSAAGTTYTYDADGQRVLKSNSTGTPTKRYWMSGGNVLAEADGSGNLTAEYVFFGGKRTVRIDFPSNTVHYWRVARPISQFLFPLRDKGCPTPLRSKGWDKITADAERFASFPLNRSKTFHNM